MQTWAKRGVHAALVTGGMLAVGSGVASASGTCPDDPAPPRGGSVLPPAFDSASDGTPRHSGQCFAGELFPEGRYETGRHARHAADQTTVFAGTIDPVRDVLPVIENETTREMPAIVDDAAFDAATVAGHTTVPQDATVPLPAVNPAAERTAPVLELAGWVAEPSTAIEHPALAQPRGRHAQRLPGTPSDGFQRSLSWEGGIGDVVSGNREKDEFPEAAVQHGHQGHGPARSPGEVFLPTVDSELAPPLVTPSADPAETDALVAADGIMDLWKGALGHGPGTGEHDLGSALLDMDTDLTAGELAGPEHSMHRVPWPLLDESLSVVPRALVPKQDAVPLRVPGEALAKASEIPPLNDLVLHGVAGKQHARADNPDVHADLPLLGHLEAEDGGEVSAPAISRIIEALSGSLPEQRADDEATLVIPKVPTFTEAPLRSLVEVIFLDDLTAALPERRQVTENPFRAADGPRANIPGEMALPLLDGLPEIDAFHGETLSSPLDELLQDPEDTVVFERV
ncbi:hypothetical protein [Parasphingorhabdus pacifica]